jgi:phosphate/sulfate permease
VVGKVIMPALFSPVIAGIVAAVGTFLIFKIVVGIGERFTEAGFRWGQIGTASLVSLAHGTNDAQKTMGVITLALIGYSASDPQSTGPLAWHETDNVPLWVKFACAAAIALGTYIGGWRIIRTLGKGLVEISSPQGMAAEASRRQSFSPPATSASRSRPPTSPPARSWVPVSASPVRRCAGTSRCAWWRRGSSPCRPPRWWAR